MTPPRSPRCSKSTSESVVDESGPDTRTILVHPRRRPPITGSLVTRVLLTAFEPYDRWRENASWMALIELTHWYDGPVELVTRRYPVDLARMSGRLRDDLSERYDHIILCGQAPGSTHLRLETVALNLRTDGTELVPGGPTAYRSGLPLAFAAAEIRRSGIPARVSHHAGTYLCNAALYMSQHYLASLAVPTPSVFVHVPLSPGQVAGDDSDAPSMSTPMVSAALAILIRELTNQSAARLSV